MVSSSLQTLLTKRSHHNLTKEQIAFRAQPERLVSRYVLFLSVAALSVWFLVILGCPTRWQSHCCEAALLEIEARNREFLNEIGMISALQHPNLVKLHGCCVEGKELLLVYEYMENNSLARALFGKSTIAICTMLAFAEETWFPSSLTPLLFKCKYSGRDNQKLHLDWQTRKKICLGIARGLAYLHEESRLKIVHRDIKATNMLLDKDLNAKISDFGLAKLDDEETSHISTRIAGTM